jgi:hypothetical protein
MNGITSGNQVRTLSLSLSIVNATAERILTAMALIIPLVALLLALLPVLSSSEPSTGDWIVSTGWKLISDIENAAMLALLILFGTAAVVLQRMAYLHVTPGGLQARIPLWSGKTLAHQTTGSWTLQWDAIRRVRLRTPPDSLRSSIQKLNWYCLVLETDEGEFKLNPFGWVDPDARDHRLGLNEVLSWRKIDTGQRIRHAPLFPIIQEQGFAIESAEDEQRQPTSPLFEGYDLTRHKGMVTQLILLAGIGGYALIDLVAGRYQPLEMVPVYPFLVAALPAAALANVLGRGAPPMERFGVGALLVIATVAATYPAMLRVNALTAEPRTLQYEAMTPGNFTPVNASTPAIDLSGRNLPEYWAEYPEGSQHEFTLMRGDAGFYQLNLAPFRARTREFYRQRREDQ